MSSLYYEDKIDSLKSIFGAREVTVLEDSVIVNGHRYPVLNDVIILLDPSQYTPHVRSELRGRSQHQTTHDRRDHAEDIQFTFGEEWKKYGSVLPEHGSEFERYFDIVDLDSLRGQRVCDLGCGIGRWSTFLHGVCRELMLVDFSDAIFVARNNITWKSALFFIEDLRRLPFKNDFCDFLFSLGVLHHLPVDCLGEVRRLKTAAPRLLIFLYYALDNRPIYFRWVLSMVTAARTVLSRIRNGVFRKVFSLGTAIFVYEPLIILGMLMKPLGLARFVPLYEFYHGKSLGRIEQDVYDRFFTRIEQRVTRKEIEGLQDTFSRVQVSDHLPYWHFLCTR